MISIAFTQAQMLFNLKKKKKKIFSSFESYILTGNKSSHSVNTEKPEAVNVSGISLQGRLCFSEDFKLNILRRADQIGASVWTNL